MKIEKGVPIPNRRGGVMIYSWDRMLPGTSVEFPTDYEYWHAAKAARQWGNKHGKKFTTRKNNGQPGGRIWCVSETRK